MAPMHEFLCILPLFIGSLILTEVLIAPPTLSFFSSPSFFDKQEWDACS
jgi:hypothetical protein